MDKYVVVSVSTILHRDKLMKKMYANLTADPVAIQTLTIVQDQVNRIRVYHNLAGGQRQLIRTYLVLVIPLLIDLSPIYNIAGDVTFELSETIKNLQDLTTKLQSLQGHRVMKGNMNESTFKQLVTSLSTPNVKY
jgi:hypothetical protein